MNVVIVGCSRLGARLASVLDKRGHTVSVIDVNPVSFSRLREGFSGETVIGTGIDEDVLLEARIDRADMFIAATNGDNRNIMSSQMAKNTFGVKQVLCRIYDPAGRGVWQARGDHYLPDCYGCQPLSRSRCA